MSTLLMSLAEKIRNLRLQAFTWKLLVITFFLFVARSVSAIIVDVCVWWSCQNGSFPIATLCCGGVH